jgi:transcriptional regulator with XRE-family HTH domain
MVIGDRVKAIRKQKNLTQGDIEKTTGLLRNYLSRLENGHSVPTVETLQKLASAMSVPLYTFFYGGSKPPIEIVKFRDDEGWGNSGKDMHTLGRFRRLLSRTSKEDQKLLLAMATKMATR